MAWIELHQEFRAHPKVARLAAKLGVKYIEAQAFLVNLWLSACAYARDGELTAFSEKEIADFARFEDDAKKLFRALIETRWIDKKDGKILIHDWKKHGLRILESSRKRQAKSRRGKDLESNSVTQPSRDCISLLSLSLSILSIPSNHSLRSPLFEEVWISWNDFRKEIKKPLRPSTVKEQISFLATQGDPSAVVKQSIRNGWQGLFELKAGQVTPLAIQKGKTGMCEYCHEPILENERYQHLNTCTAVIPQPKEVKDMLDGLGKSMSAK